MQATCFVREETGEVTLHDGEDKNVYLPPVMTKWYCYKWYCADNGYKVKTSSSGKTSLEEDPSFEGQRKKMCCLVCLLGLLETSSFQCQGKLSF